MQFSSTLLMATASIAVIAEHLRFFARNKLMATARFIVFATCVVVGLRSADAALTIFSGFDAGVGAGAARPNADAAAASFDAAAGLLGPVNLIDLESTPPTSSTIVQPVIGVTMTFTNHTTAFNTILDSNFDAANGYNTTLGGDTWALVFPQNSDATTTLVFDFDTPVQAWGTYHTGLGSVSAQVFVQFNDGAPQSFPLTGSGLGGVGFFGFTDPGKSISSISWVVDPFPSSADAIGIDDIHFVDVPEPSTCVISISGLLAVALCQWRRRRGAGKPLLKRPQLSASRMAS